MEQERGPGDEGSTPPANTSLQEHHDDGPAQQSEGVNQPSGITQDERSENVSSGCNDSIPLNSASAENEAPNTPREDIPVVKDNMESVTTPAEEKQPIISDQGEDREQQSDDVNQPSTSVQDNTSENASGCNDSIPLNTASAENETPNTPREDKPEVKDNMESATTPAEEKQPIVSDQGEDHEQQSDDVNHPSSSVQYNTSENASGCNDSIPLNTASAENETTPNTPREDKPEVKDDMESGTTPVEEKQPIVSDQGEDHEQQSDDVNQSSSSVQYSTSEFVNGCNNAVPLNSSSVEKENPNKPRETKHVVKDSVESATLPAEENQSIESDQGEPLEQQSDDVNQSSRSVQDNIRKEDEENVKHVALENKKAGAVATETETEEITTESTIVIGQGEAESAPCSKGKDNAETINHAAVENKDSYANSTEKGTEEITVENIVGEGQGEPKTVPHSKGNEGEDNKNSVSVENNKADAVLAKKGNEELKSKGDDGTEDLKTEIDPAYKGINQPDDDKSTITMDNPPKATPPGKHGQDVSRVPVLKGQDPLSNTSQDNDSDHHPTELINGRKGQVNRTLKEEYNARFTEMQRQIQRLEKNNKDLEKSLDKATALNTTITKENEDLLKKDLETQQKLCTMETEAESNERRISEMKLVIQAQEEKLTKEKKDMEKMQTKLMHDKDNAREREVKLQQQIKNKEQIIKKKEGEIKDLNKKTSESKDFIGRLQARIQEITSQKTKDDNKYRERVKELQECVSDERKNFNDLSYQYNQLIQQNQAFSENIIQVYKEKKDIEHEKQELLLRLSKLAGANLTYNNPNIADLSDEKRPTKLAEEFSELYDNEWTDAFEDMSIEDERHKTTVMLEMLKHANQLCNELSTEHRRKIQQSFCTLTFHEALPAVEAHDKIPEIGTKEATYAAREKSKDRTTITESNQVRGTCDEVSKTNNKDTETTVGFGTNEVFRKQTTESAQDQGMGDDASKKENMDTEKTVELEPNETSTTQDQDMKDDASRKENKDTEKTVELETSETSTKQTTGLNQDDGACNDDSKTKKEVTEISVEFATNENFTKQALEPNQRKTDTKEQNEEHRTPEKINKKSDESLLELTLQNVDAGNDDDAGDGNKEDVHVNKEKDLDAGNETGIFSGSVGDANVGNEECSEEDNEKTEADSNKKDPCSGSAGDASNKEGQGVEGDSYVGKQGTVEDVGEDGETGAGNQEDVHVSNGTALNAGKETGQFTDSVGYANVGNQGASDDGNEKAEDDGNKNGACSGSAGDASNKEGSGIDMEGTSEAGNTTDSNICNDGGSNGVHESDFNLSNKGDNSDGGNAVDLEVGNGRDSGSGNERDSHSGTEGDVGGGNETDLQDNISDGTKSLPKIIKRKIGLDFEKELKNEQKKTIMEIGKVFESKLSEEVEKIGTEIILRELKINPGMESVVAFIRKSMNICWSMCRHVPPVHVDFPDVTGDIPFDTNKYKPYTKNGKYVHYIVWPAVYLHDGGPMLCKGVAQGRK